MKLLKKIHKKESGQAFILVLILLLLGGLMIGPLLGFMGTGLLTGQAYEQRMAEVYAADAGVEDAIYNIITPAAPHYADLQDLNEGEPLPPYILTDPINGETVEVTVTKLSLIQALLGEDEYKTDQPHEDWVTFDTPLEDRTYGTDENGAYVEYACEITFEYLGDGNRTVVSIGTFFYPFSGEESSIVPPVYDNGDIDYILVITRDYLEGDEPELKTVPGGFAFIWRWPKTPPRGALNFRFRVYNVPGWLDPEWEASYYGWATFKEQDISYVTNVPDRYKWLIEATAGDTTVLSAILEETGTVHMLTWEINPPG